MNLYNEKIKFMHFRHYVDGKPQARGGATVAYYETIGGDGKTPIFIYAISKCSRKDNFSRNEGRSWAVKRLKHGWAGYGSDADTFRKSMAMQVEAATGFTRQYGKRKVRKERLPSRMERNTEMNNTTINCS